MERHVRSLTRKMATPVSAQTDPIAQMIALLTLFTSILVALATFFTNKEPGAR